MTLVFLVRVITFDVIRVVLVNAVKWKGSGVVNLNSKVGGVCKTKRLY